jgi:hypothetical protein
MNPTTLGVHIILKFSHLNQNFKKETYSFEKSSSMMYHTFQLEMIQPLKVSLKWLEIN